MHIKSPFMRLVALTFSLTLLSCQEQDETQTMKHAKCPNGQTGTIAAAVEQSCPTVIELDGGEIINYGGQEENIGKRVRVEYEIDSRFEGMVSFCMQGKPVKVTCFEIIDE